MLVKSVGKGCSPTSQKKGAEKILSFRASTWHSGRKYKYIQRPASICFLRNIPPPLSLFVHRSNQLKAAFVKRLKRGTPSSTKGKRTFMRSAHCIASRAVYWGCGNRSSICMVYIFLFGLWSLRGQTQD